MIEERVGCQANMKCDNHENKVMRNLHKVVEELQWNLKYL